MKGYPMSHQNQPNETTTPRGKYDDLAIELADRLEAQFSLLYVLGGNKGNGMSVQHMYTEEEKPEKMRLIAKTFDFLADWARKEAGDRASH